MSDMPRLPDTIMVGETIINTRHIRCIQRIREKYDVHTTFANITCEAGTPGCRDVEEFWNARYAHYVKRHGLSTDVTLT